MPHNEQNSMIEWFNYQELEDQMQQKADFHSAQQYDYV